MIVTLTPNPSVDRTIEVDALHRGAVLRAKATRVDPGGKGVNVSRALAACDTATIAVLPSGGPEGAQLAALLAPFGNDAGRVRLVAEGDIQHFLRRRHLEIERQAGGSLDAGDVIVADMAAIFAKVRGDAVAARACDDFRGAHRIGVIAAARVADRGDVVDVDAEAELRGTNEVVHRIRHRIRRGCPV